MTLSSSEDDQEVEEEANMGKPLENCYAGKSRIDSKPATLRLEERSIDFYFGTLLRDGEMCMRDMHEWFQLQNTLSNQLAA